MSRLSVSALSAGYGQGPVLHAVDVEVSDGGVSVVLGANGAGKTTLLRAISGMIEREGTVTVDAVRIDGMRTEEIARLGVTHVPEGRGTFAGLTTEENLRLGRALMSGPSLVLLDEPSFGLAPRMIEELYRILEDIHAREHVSILLVEQNAAIALDLADRVYVFETGRVVLAGPPSDLRGDASLRRAYLGS